MLNPDYPHQSSQQFQGICIDLLNRLQRRIGFHYTVYLSPDGKYGVEDQITNEWNGIIGEVVKKASTIGYTLRVAKSLYAT